MDYFDMIQKSVDFIENHICDDIQTEEIARNSACSPYHFQRIFSAVTGDSVKEYVRKRRLSLAAKDLAGSDVKVIDVALKYGYETPEAFTKAFKKFHDSTPMFVKRSGSFRYREKAFVQVYKSMIIEGGIEMDYKIVEKDSFKVIGPELKVRNDNGDNFRLIPKFWDKFEKDGMYEVIKSMPNVINKGDAIMGMCADFDGVNTFDYLICVEAGSFDHIPEGMVGKTVPKQKYAVFTAEGKMPEAIQKTWKYIYGKWFPISGRERADGPDFEYYDKRSEKNDENCEVDIYIPIK